MSRPIVVLRPEPGNGETAERVRAAGFTAIAMPLFEARPLMWTAPDPAEFDLLLLTSANAVRHGGPGLARVRHLPVAAIGRATARAAREAGLSVRMTGGADIDSLLAAIPDVERLRILHLSGRHRTPTGLDTIVPIAVYESVAIPPPRQIVATLPGAVVLLHSKRAARVFCDLLTAAAIPRSTLAVACLSAAIAEEAGEGWSAVMVAAEPNDAALVAAAGRLAD